VDFGWLTRLGSPFLKIFWADISKNLKFFRSGPETALEAREICSRIAADTRKRSRAGSRHYNRRGDAQIPRSGVLFRFACPARGVDCVK